MGKIRILDGNHSAAIGALLSRPDVVAAYPITPQTPLVQFFSQYVADGAMDSSIVEPESEHSAMSILEGASMAGGRTFTATSSQGLALMYEPYFRASTLRLPIVMNIVNREMISPQTVWGGPQDSLTVRDAGWIQIYVEDNQEILDMTIQAFKIAENKDVLLPVNICYDGFYLSHMNEGVDVPTQAEVDGFLTPYKATHLKLDPECPMSVDPLTPGEYLQYYRELHMSAMDSAKRVICEVNKEFAEKFGRDHFGLTEGYRMEDAEYAIVTMGSMTGSGRVAVDRARDEGKKVGLVKIRALRPFPKEDVRNLLKNVKAIGVVDRNVSFGWHTGIVYQEIMSAVSSMPSVPTVPFIGGLGGEDITTDLMCDAVARTIEAGESGQLVNDTMWLINNKGR